MSTKEKAFSIDFDNIGWLEGFEENPADCCAHAHVVAQIGAEIFEYHATASATALYLLKSLSENHVAYQEEQFLPCCGFNIIANKGSGGDVFILGCPSGIDWDLVHIGEAVEITTDSGLKTLVPFGDYREEVLEFVDKVEAFYESQPPRMPAEDDAIAYKAFWNEWHRRRREA